MDDFSNYRPSSKDMLMWSSRQIFEYQLDDEGEDVVVDGIPARAIIQTHTNPYNQLKDDRKFLCPTDVKVSRGSIVDYCDKKWLVINEVRSNEVYQYLTIMACSHILNVHKNGILYEVPCCVESGIRLFQLGLENGKYFDTPETVVTVRVPANDITENIKRGQVYAIGRQNWKINDVNDIIEPNLLILKMEWTAEQPETPEEPEPTQPIEITGADSVIFGSSSVYTVAYPEDIVFSLEGEFASIVEQDGSSCTIKAGNSYGYVTLVATFEDIEGRKDVLIKNYF